MNTCLNCHLPKHPNHSQFDTFCLKLSGWKPEDFTKAKEAPKAA